MTDSARNYLMSKSCLQPTISALYKETGKDLEFQKNFIEKELNSVSDIILVIDPKNYRIISANEAAFKKVNLDKKNLIGKTYHEAIHQKLTPFSFTNDKCLIQEVLNTKKSVVVEYRHFDQENSRIYEVSVHPITNKDGKIIQIVRIEKEITKQKEAEEKLKKTEEKYRALLNATNVLVQSVDVRGRFVFVNEEWKIVLGYTEKDLDNIIISDVVRKDHLQFCMNAFNQVMKGMCIRHIETVFVAKDGREIIVRGNACPIFKNGEFVSAVAFFVDITDRKKSEERIKESTRQIELMVEKLRVVGSLTRHDVRNKLSTVTGYAYLLKKKHPEEADIINGLSKMEQAVKETVRIFDFAKMYEQLGAEELKYIDVEAKLNEASTLFSGGLPKIINKCHGLTLLADSFLRQLFYNFLDNTEKYGQKTTTILVRYEKVGQQNLKLIYEDDGIGIPIENKQNLFKEDFSGGGSTGFGLFLIKKMMDVYGWTIEENGESGKGAKFTITIPKLSQSGIENYKISY